MEVTLPVDLSTEVERAVASGQFDSRDELIQQAIRLFLDERRRGQRRLEALRRVGQAVDEADLYEAVLVPDQN